MQQGRPRQAAIDPRPAAAGWDDAQLPGLSAHAERAGHDVEAVHGGLRPGVILPHFGSTRLPSGPEGMGRVNGAPLAGMIRPLAGSVGGSARWI